ncbi:MAG: SDR family NAD(P)-dependent oxidoreductase [Devosiaceae bacterium]|nr:SDR family NAD(P)-dependent oxidoreductase [Devosiaceae bacterium]
MADKNELIIIARDSKNLALFKKKYPDMAILAANLSDQEMVISTARDIIARYPEIDGLINNAALQYTPRFVDPQFKIDQITNEITINFTSPCQLCFLLLPPSLKGK